MTATGKRDAARPSQRRNQKRSFCEPHAGRDADGWPAFAVAASTLGGS
jgi:hypothetical protein